MTGPGTGRPAQLPRVGLRLDARVPVSAACPEGRSGHFCPGGWSGGGPGERIFDGVETFGFEPAEVLHSPLTTHIRYRRVS